VPSLQTLQPHAKDLGGGFMVRRLLPAADRRAVGPFVFFDHFGPIEVQPGGHHDVRPHPHIGLATLSYLFDGAIMHRDSTGVVQRIEPGAVNWMSAGRGIVHSERTPKDLIGTTYRSHGLQLWIALPEAMEDSAPSFQHVPAAAIPEIRLPAGSARVFAGSAFGVSAPVETASPTLAVAFDLGVGTGAGIELDPADASERALYAVDHPFEIDGVKVDEFTLVVLEPGSRPTISAPRGGRVVLIGGEPLGHRFVSWNFVASTRERIRAAEADWRAQRFPPVPGETEFIPLPEKPAPTMTPDAPA
jgi:redox-sensitive bicupin YhaK (pirin superfamily)